jgi:hypothetical protein
MALPQKKSLKLYDRNLFQLFILVYSHIKVLFWLIHIAITRNGYMYQLKRITFM